MALPDDLDLGAYERALKFNHDGFHPSCGGFRIRRHGPNAKGAVHKGGKHYIDHLHWVFSGAELIEWEAPDGRTGRILVEVIDWPIFVPILDRCYHRITALVDGTRSACQFSRLEAEEKYGDSNSVPWDQEDHGG